MDIKNPVHTTGTYRLARAEQLALLLVCSGLVVWHRDQLHWWRALAAFSLIDAIGYIPGAIVYRRSGGRPIPAIYHYMYNFAHNYLVLGAGIAIWAYLSGPEWAMLAAPLHLSIDRGVFGNIFKPVALPFEPVPVPDLWAKATGEAREWQS